MKGKEKQHKKKKKGEKNLGGAGEARLVQKLIARPVAIGAHANIKSRPIPHACMVEF